MDKNQPLPLTFQMALAHTPRSMYAFLRLDNEKQDEIIKRAESTKTKREMQLLVEEIPKMI